MQYLRDAGMEVIAPPESAIEEVLKAARVTGDTENLSEADIEVLAVAFHLKGSKLFTDDYAMQNVASHIGIDYESILQEGIKRSSTGNTGVRPAEDLQNPEQKYVLSAAGR